MPICTSQMNVRVDDRGGGHSDLPTPTGQMEIYRESGSGFTVAGQCRIGTGLSPLRLMAGPHQNRLIGDILPHLRHFITGEMEQS